MFSGGKSSFSVAAYVKEHFPNDNIVLYFNDTLWEDEDLYRFTHEASDKLELPMLTHSRGFTPIQLFVIQTFMGNNRVGTCSRYLKQKVAGDFFRHGKVPRIEKWYNKQYLKNEDFTTKPILYFGIGFEEMHRAGPIIKNWKPFEVEFPLIEHIIDNNKVLESFNIRQPRMYDLQFAHNNCAGRCVKAGQGHFLNLLRKDSALFQEFKEQEIVVSAYIRYTNQVGYSSDRDYLIQEVWNFVSTGRKTDKLQHIIDTHKYMKNAIHGGRNRPYSFMKNLTLEDLEKKPNQLDIWDIGGCGCYSDFDKAESETCELAIR
jgi:hypothetical protein